MRKVVIYGAGAYGKILYHDMTQFSNMLDPVAFTMEEKYIISNKLYDIPVVPFEKITEKYPASEY